MELFYSAEISGGLAVLDAEESLHCVKVLRHRPGDELNIIDGEGTLYKCVLEKADPKGSLAKVVGSVPGWGSHPYRLTMAVCPTKNNERYEWFIEKACEVGLDVVQPVIGDHSERKVYKTDRARKILLSATKQSLKAAIPAVEEPVSVKDFIKSMKDSGALKMIAYCFEDPGVPRRSIKEVLASGGADEIAVLIGPEGDFSPAEAALAIECGFVPVHLGDSRLRTETAALTAVEAVYFNFMR